MLTAILSPYAHTTWTLASSNILERVVRIEHGGSIGTGTIIEHDAGVFILTAAHVLSDDEAAPMTVYNRLRSHEGPLRRVPGINPSLDIALVEAPPHFAMRHLGLADERGVRVLPASTLPWLPLWTRHVEPNDQAPTVRKERDCFRFRAC